MLSVSKKVDYGMRLMIALPDKGDNEYSSLRNIAREACISERFLEHIAFSLKNAGLIQAKEGARGGYQLAKKRDRITIAEIVSAIEGPLALTSCQKQNGIRCECEANCSAKTVWDELQRLISKMLRKKTLAELSVSIHFKKS